MVPQDDILTKDVSLGNLYSVSVHSCLSTKSTLTQLKRLTGFHVAKKILSPDPLKDKLVWSYSAFSNWSSSSKRTKLNPSTPLALSSLSNPVRTTLPPVALLNCLSSSCQPLFSLVVFIPNLNDG